MYLAIGLFVYFRRRNAPRALHFFLLCLASFVMSTFHYTGKLNNFDKVIYLGNVVAGSWRRRCSCTSASCFPEPQKWIRRRGAAVLVYLPGLALLAIQLGFALGWLRTAAPLLEVRWLLDRVWLVFLCAMYLAGGVVLAFQLRHADDPDRAAPIDLAAQRRAGRDSAVRADLRDAVPDGRARRITR